MAGWKLRKDKTPAETPGDVVQSVEGPTAEQGAQIYAATSPQSEMPQTEAEDNSTSPGLAAPDSLNGEGGYSTREPAIAMPPPDFEADQDLRFDDAEEEDGPLTLVDYSSPEAHAPSSTPSFETPTTDSTTDLLPTDFTSTLRMNREELAAATAPMTPTAIPTVPPFVLDTPLVAPTAEAVTPRLVVRLGRLSAAFDITKEVTVIGRPDSATQFYPDVEIDMDDAISRRHAEVLRRGEDFFLVDTGSTNGTLLNGEKLPAQEERLLAHGDRIRVGERTEIVFE